MTYSPMPTRALNRSKSRRRILRVPSSYACQAFSDRSSLAAARACVRPAAARRAFISAGVGGRGLGIRIPLKCSAINSREIGTEQPFNVPAARDSAIDFIDGHLSFHVDASNIGQRGHFFAKGWADKKFGLNLFLLNQQRVMRGHCVHDFCFNLGYRSGLLEFNDTSIFRNDLNIIAAPVAERGYCSGFEGREVGESRRVVEVGFAIKHGCIEVFNLGVLSYASKPVFSTAIVLTAIRGFFVGDGQVVHDFLSVKHSSKIAGINELYAYFVGVTSIKSGFYQLFYKGKPYV